jgi:Rv2632c-like
LARRHPADPDVPEIGDELAVGRAFIELGERLVHAASEDIAALGRAR